MTRRRRLPGTRALLVLPSIPDDAPEDVKSGLAIRNVCATEGRCPSCGAEGEVYSDRAHPLFFHLVFRHEDWCPCLTDNEAA